MELNEVKFGNFVIPEERYEEKQKIPIYNYNITDILI